MITKHDITREQALYAISNGEFGSDVLSRQNVIVIMTQDWCPQWLYMSNWIYSLDTDKDIDIYVLIYNKTDFFRSFMQFKENTFRNSSVPYLRIYKNGSLANETNYIGAQRLLELLKD